MLKHCSKEGCRGGNTKDLFLISNHYRLKTNKHSRRNEMKRSKKIGTGFYVPENQPLWREVC
jgi:hypothetical protein